MITCEHILKVYKTQTILEDFSYRFDDTGFYLLFGESGSGKTTFLNILAGHIPYDGGAIFFDGEKYTKQVDAKKWSNEIDYITQDANFIDYLSVYDNLALCTRDDEIIKEYLEKFGLLGKVNALPNKLSGGEKQRVCLIRSLIQNKKILLLDEPTASLDDKNKRQVLETLKELKTSVLVICSSHDEVAKEYADCSIDFNNLEAYSNTEELEETAEVKDSVRAKKKRFRRRIGPYIRKWFKSPYKNKMSRICFGFIMTLAMIALCMGDTPKNKFYSSIEYIYGINQLQLIIQDERFDYMETLYEREDIKEIVLDYEYTVPVTRESPDSPMVTADYELALWTLPEEAENLHIKNPLAYGRYIENENEIILSDAMAISMGYSNALIGRKINVKLYDGEHEMTIVGIFREFSETECEYLHNSGVGIYEEKSMYDDRYAVSAKYTNQFLDDLKFVNESDGSRCYILYFDSYSAMMDFYNEVYVKPGETNGVFFIPPTISVEMSHVFYMMNKNIFPIAAIIMLIAVIFYYQTQRTELMYNKKIFAVYQYLGYSIKQVKLKWMLYSMIELLKIFVVSVLATWGITHVVNLVNREKKIIPFEIFTYNTRVILLMFGAVMITGAVNLFFMLRKLKAEAISENLVNQRDLL